MSINQPKGLFAPQRLTLQDLSILLQRRLQEIYVQILRTPPAHFGRPHDPYYCKEAFESWAEAVGLYQGVIEVLDGARGDLFEEMMDDLFSLHMAIDHMEVRLGVRRSASSG